MTNVDIEISAAVDQNACREVGPKQLDQQQTNHRKTIDVDVPDNCLCNYSTTLLPCQ